MILAKLFTKIFQEGGIILIDADNQKYLCGQPRQINPITVKLLKKDLNWKILLNPELEFPEGYIRGDIIIENASLKDFLMEVVKNLGRNEIGTASIFFKKIYQAWRFISNYNFPGKSKKMLRHIMTLEEEKVKFFTM